MKEVLRFSEREDGITASFGESFSICEEVAPFLPVSRPMFDSLFGAEGRRWVGLYDRRGRISKLVNGEVLRSSAPKAVDGAFFAGPLTTFNATVVPKTIIFLCFLTRM